MALTLTPEQEARVERIVQAGRFDTPEEALEMALSSLDKPRITPELTARLKKVRTQNLVELFRASPFADTEIDFPRDHSPWRQVDFD